MSLNYRVYAENVHFERVYQADCDYSDQAATLARRLLSDGWKRVWIEVTEC